MFSFISPDLSRVPSVSVEKIVLISIFVYWPALRKSPRASEVNHGTMKMGTEFGSYKGVSEMRFEILRFISMEISILIITLQLTRSLVRSFMKFWAILDNEHLFSFLDNPIKRQRK
jgi:hypothetical protein